MTNLYQEHKNTPGNVMERILANYIETGRSIRELADYYDIPKSTISDWLQGIKNILDYDSYNNYLITAKKHKRRMIMENKGYEEYIKIYGDGPLD